jgi:hypothetical protein
MKLWLDTCEEDPVKRKTQHLLIPPTEQRKRKRGKLYRTYAEQES